MNNYPNHSNKLQKKLALFTELEQKAQIFYDDSYLNKSERFAVALTIAADDVRKLCTKFGTQAVVTSIVKLIREKNVGFPFKKLLITKEQMTKMFTKIQNLKITWNHDPFEIKDQKKSRFKLPIEFALSAEDKPRPWVYLHEKKDYWEMDILVDWFIERSRIHAKRSNSKYSPAEAWANDDNYVWKAVDIALRKSGAINAHTLREALYDIPTVCECPHEKASFTSGLFRLLSPTDRAPHIFDACAGWGDRLVASMAIGAERYLGIDPNMDSKPYFEEIVKTLAPLVSKNNVLLQETSQRFKVLCDAMPSAILPDATKESFDISFISPPSYNTEIYGHHAGQSIQMFPNRDDWMTYFLFRTLQRCWHLLRPNGYLIIQSLLASEINAYIRLRLPGAKYLGVVANRTGALRKKPMWIWKKDSQNKHPSPFLLPSRELALKSLSVNVQKNIEQNEDML